MEDENGLELSLGLCCGGSSGKSKIPGVNSAPKVEAGSSNRLDTNTSDPSFKSFFQTGSDQHDNNVNKGKQKNDSNLPQHGNFWTDLGKCSASVRDASHDVNNNLSQFTRYQELWSSNNKTADSEENSNKRKLPFEEIDFKNKHENGVDYAITPCKKTTSVNLTRNSQVSTPAKDASTGENEDIAESEAEGSNSWLVSQHEDKLKCADKAKFTDKHVLSDSSGIASKGHKETPVSRTEATREPGDVAYGIPLSLQPLHVMTAPYPVPVKVASTPSAPNPMRFPSPCVMQLMPVANTEHPTGQPLNTNNSQVAFGYSTVQLPTLETGSSWAFNSQPRQVTPFTSKEHADGALNSASSDVKTSHAHTARVPSPAVVFEGKSLDAVKVNNNKYLGEVGTSSKIQDEVKENFSIFRPNETASQPGVEGSSQRGSTIKPGIASEIKFGGCGSRPDLPWVSATGSGPNGKTISGVTYKYSQNQVKVVCACHGTHMSPEEFVLHASADAARAENPNSNTAA